MSSAVLVKFSFDYGDEFDIFGFTAYPREKWNLILDNIKKRFEKNSNVEWWFGTNESLQFNSFQDFMDGIVEIEISADELQTLIRLFGYNNNVSFGQCPLI